MATNVEIKAKIDDFAKVSAKAEEIADNPVQVIFQHDTFFESLKGRLKLRRFPSGMAELIYYERADEAGPKASNYYIVGTDDPDGLQTVLSGAYGVLGEVIKERHLYLVGRTRIHLDKVECLGTYLELEVVLSDNDTVDEGMSEAKDIMRQLGVAAEALVEGAYLDLLRS